MEELLVEVDGEDVVELPVGLPTETVVEAPLDKLRSSFLVVRCGGWTDGRLLEEREARRVSSPLLQHLLSRRCRLRFDGESRRRPIARRRQGQEPRDIIKPRRCAKRHLELLGEDLRDDDRVALREVREPTRIAIDNVTKATMAEKRAA